MTTVAAQSSVNLLPVISIPLATIPVSSHEPHNPEIENNLTNVSTVSVASDENDKPLVDCEIGLTTGQLTTLDSTLPSSAFQVLNQELCNKPNFEITEIDNNLTNESTVSVASEKNYKPLVDSEIGLTTGQLTTLDSTLPSSAFQVLNQELCNKPNFVITAIDNNLTNESTVSIASEKNDKPLVDSEIGLTGQLTTLDSTLPSSAFQFLNQEFCNKPNFEITEIDNNLTNESTVSVASEKNYKPLVDSEIGLTTGQLTTLDSTLPSSAFQVLNQELCNKPNFVITAIDNNLTNESTVSVASEKNDKPLVDSEIGLTTGQLTTFDSTLPSSAFQILHQELCNKPNAIVRPMNFKKIDTKSNTNNKDKFSETNSNNKNRSVIKKIYRQVETFAKELDLKLRRLKTNDKLSNSSKNTSNQDSINKRPLFITTVPTGIFLPPNVIPVNHVYSYSSHPKIFTIYRPNNNYTTVAEYFENSKDPNERRIVKREIYKNDKEILKKSTATKCNAVPQSKGIRTIYNNATNRGDNPLIPTYGNVMFDRRVIRGTNYAPCHIRPWNPYFAYAGLLSGKESDPDCKEAETKRRLMLRRRTLSRNRRCVIGTPPPICGRRHENVQTEKYLEELFERPPEYDVNTQTDLFLQRPPSPPYVPAKTGIDVATEILDGELFNFDAEVEPILETLVGHTVKQGLIEVLHEEEIAELKKQQEEFLALREADLAELRRLEAEESRLQNEKERRIRQDEIAEELDAKMQERVTASKLLQGHIANILPEVLASLEPATDAARKEDLERKVCPWLTKELADEVGQIVDSREILTAILKEIIIERAKIYGNYPEEEQESVDIEECLGDECPEPEMQEEDCKCD